MYQPDILKEVEGKELLKIARKTLDNFVRHEPTAKPKSYPDKLNEVYGVFCTIFKDGSVRGRAVVGLPYPLLSIIDASIAAVISAAHEDLRFTRIKPSELSEVKIEISILTEPQLLDVKFPAEKYFQFIVPDADGVMLKYGVYESFLPPQAWRNIKDKGQFLDQLCMQAGLTKGMWKEEGIELYKFQAQVFGEE